ncbi:carboxypeptidase S [Lentinus tigrinus ALCF2SS1-7]|uniref:Carboxypeptidase S n=1 Tax=Lentinus tigrinus ALCF2SS1-6 TaxID=1328759 RepID=A0A5C2SMS6_9APHY|nr:carboxypeptidase S [Lentinus tigrinus ALCF2SS1-6]RPD76599.1 carboxypeptidase S [Lentinus tigrinus ALCF2SS1-7]
MSPHKGDTLLPSTTAEVAPAKRSTSAGLRFVKGLLVGIALWTCLHAAGVARVPACLSDALVGEEYNAEAQCPQVSAVTPEKSSELWSSLGETLSTDAFKTRAVEWLGGAVRVPTQSFDKMGPVGEDPRWEVFGPFHDYLLKAFPLVHSTLELTKVNTWGLVYVWKGSDASLKPLLLAAHQDVVPVNPDTVDKWTHPPFSGYFDGERIWGRGSSDDKSGLIAIMSTIESLLERNFQPTRGVVLTFGFDEETSGLHGAASLSEYLVKTFGENAFLLLVDEGGGFAQEYDGVVATPAVAEKGYIDVRVEVTSPGGHSSVPPSHTTIGILSQLLVHYEANPYEPILSRDTPMYWKSQCLAAHVPGLPHKLRKALKKGVKSDHALKEAQKELFKERAFRALVGTTQAIDLINGGVKTNALPEQAWAVVNHRIATDSSVDAVKEHDTALLKSLAQEFNLSYAAFGSQVTGEDAPAYGTLTLTDAWGTALEPAPISPIDAPEYALLSGTIKATYNAHRSLKKDDSIVVAPGIMSGNTDTRYYWALTPHIYRYNHHNSGNGTALSNGVHTINESIDADAFVEMIRFFSTLILNADEFSA